MESVRKNLELYKKLAPTFQRIFSVKLDRFWNNLTGFDVVKLDEEIVKPDDGTSTRAKVREQWGEEGEALCVQLLG